MREEYGGESMEGRGREVRRGNENGEEEVMGREGKDNTSVPIIGVQ